MVVGFGGVLFSVFGFGGCAAVFVAWVGFWWCCALWVVWWSLIVGCLILGLSVDLLRVWWVGQYNLYDLVVCAGFGFVFG